MVADLVARALHLLTSVARDDFMRASLPMRAYFKNMHLFAAFVLAFFDYFRARLLQMLIDHVDSQRCLTTYIRTGEHCLVKHLAHNWMYPLPRWGQLTAAVWALAIFEVRAVSSRVTTINANKFVARWALSRFLCVIAASEALNKVKRLAACKELCSFFPYLIKIEVHLCLRC